MLHAADPGASDDDDKEVESSSAESQCATRCPASDPTVTSLDLKSLKGNSGNSGDQYLILSVLICSSF